MDNNILFAIRLGMAYASCGFVPCMLFGPSPVAHALFGDNRAMCHGFITGYLSI